MPYAAGVYTVPPGTTATTLTAIDSTDYNAFVADIEAAQNTARPIVAGGTGETTAIAAADAFSTKGNAIASAATCDIGAATGRFVHITGTTTITGFGTKTAGVVRFLTFDGALTLTHNATSLILPGGANIVTAAGDVAAMVSEGSGNWRCMAYTRASRELLTANRTYYVRTDGSDSNTGLANTAGGAFLTIQKALDVAYTLDLSGYVVTIQLADGTYTAGATVHGLPAGATNTGNGYPIYIQGNAVTPSNVVVSTTSANCFTANFGARLYVKNMKLQTTTGGDCLEAKDNSVIDYANVDFGACAAYHLLANDNSHITSHGSYTISGSALGHMHITTGSGVTFTAGTITITGTPNFSAFFMGLSSSARVEYQQTVTFSGSATGKRFVIHYGASLFTEVSGRTYLPGDTEGEIEGGGIYDGYNGYQTFIPQTLATAVDGRMQYKDNALYFGNPKPAWQVIEASQINVLTADRALADASTFQPLFASTEDIITLNANTAYAVEGFFWITRSAGTTSHTVSVNFGGTLGGGTATWLWEVANPTGAVLATPQIIPSTTIGAVVLTAANTSATENIVCRFKGIIRTGTSGTLQIGVQYSAAPGGVPTVKRDSYFKLSVLGIDTLSHVGYWG